MPRIKILFISTLRLFGPTILLLLFAEASARFFSDEKMYPLRPDAILNHTWKPNFRRVVDQFTTRGIPAYNKTTNSQSWLSERDFASIKPDATYRIVYMGDSFTEGTCDDSNTLPSIVERNLQVPEGKKIEVINTGTSSYSPTLYYLLLKTKILEFSPDLIVVNVDMTDVFDDSLYRMTIIRDSHGEIIACPPGHPAITTHRRTAQGLEELSLIEQLILRTAKMSKLVDLTLAKINQYRGDQNYQNKSIPPLFAWCSEQRDEKVASDVAWSMSILRKTIQLARKHGVKIIITGVPHLEQLLGLWSQHPMEDLAALCKEEGVPFLNPINHIKDMLGNESPASIYIPSDMHFNPLGYKIWAETHIRFLSEYLSSDLKD